MTLSALSLLSFSSRAPKKPGKTTPSKNAAKALRDKQNSLKVALGDPTSGEAPITLKAFMREHDLPTRARGLLASLITAYHQATRRAKRLVDNAGAPRSGTAATDPHYRKWANRATRIRNFLKLPELKNILKALPPCRNTTFIDDGADCLAFRDKAHPARKENVLRVRRVRSLDTNDYQDPKIAHLVWQPKEIARVGERVIETQPYAPPRHIRPEDIAGIREAMAEHGFALYDDHPDNFGRRGKQVKIVDLQVPLKED